MTSPRSSGEHLADMLRRLPSVHELLATDALARAAQRMGRGPTRDAARYCLDQLRGQLRQGDWRNVPQTVEACAREVLRILDGRSQQTIRRVVNATGILLHTGLGRAPLAEEAVEAVVSATGYCNVELNLATGERSSRVAAVETDLCALTGAEAAHVVNNNAGATGLTLATLTAGREVVVSHGELIEIGGGYRLPDVFEAYGAVLRAVGTTNRTRVDDYRAAINENTGAVMVIHTSNYRVVGFTQSPELAALAKICHAQGVPLIHDIGSGAQVELSGAGTHADPIARQSIQHGADLVLFSGDKLLGGPQCGVIVGKRNLIAALAHHPMSRALRIDKMTLAALQATLTVYRRAESDQHAYNAIPLLRLMRTPIAELERRANRLAARLADVLPGWTVTMVESASYAGGGSLPGSELPSRAIALESDEQDLIKCAAQLRLGEPSVVGRIQDRRLLLDLRCVFPEEDDMLFCRLEEALQCAESADQAPEESP